jgi:hypothetical protein
MPAPSQVPTADLLRLAAETVHAARRLRAEAGLAIGRLHASIAESLLLRGARTGSVWVGCSALYADQTAARPEHAGDNCGCVVDDSQHADRFTR